MNSEGDRQPQMPGFQDVINHVPTLERKNIPQLPLSGIPTPLEQVPLSAIEARPEYVREFQENETVIVPTDKGGQANALVVDSFR